MTIERLVLVNLKKGTHGNDFNAVKISIFIRMQCFESSHGRVITVMRVNKHLDLIL